MIDKELFWKIKDLEEHKKMSVTQISKEVNLDRKTVQKWLETEYLIPQTRPQRISILEPYKKIIQSMLDVTDYSAVQIYQELVTKNYIGSVNLVRNYVRTIRPGQKKVYATLDFIKGDVAQVDFGYCGYIYVGNTKRRLYVFSIVLCYSRKMYIKFIMKQNQEHFLSAHQEAFEYFGGVPHKIMVDNCKVAVLSNPKYGSYTLNPVYAEFAKYHGFEISPCGVRKPYEKGRVEKSIDYIKRNFLRGFEIITLDAVNFAAENWLENIANVRIHATTKRKPNDMFEEEKESLIKLPIRPYDCGILKNVKSNSQYRIHFEGNKYSVPAAYATSCLAMKIYPEKLLFYYKDKLIAIHERSYDSNKDVVDDNHNKEYLQGKLKAREQKELATFMNIGHKMETFYKELRRLNHPAKKEVKRILALKDIYPDDEINNVISDCLELGAINASAVENLLGTRKRVTQDLHPLHITKNSDCLKIQIKKPDLNLYKVK
jgi:transposase